MVSNIAARIGRATCVASVLLALAACRGTDESPPRAALSTSAAPAAPATLEIQRSEYQVTLRHEVALATGLVTTEVSGTLTTERSTREPATRELRLDFRGLRASARQQGNGGEARFEGLERPAWITLEPQGQPSAIHFEPDVPTSTRQLAEYLASELFHAHEGGGQEHWQTRERDNSGSFGAEYRRQGRTLTKRKLEYSQGRGGGKLGIDKAEWQLELSELGHPTRIISEQKLRLTDLDSAVSSSGRIELGASTTLRRPADWLRPAATAHRYPFGDASLQSRAETDRQLIGRATLEQTLEQLRQATGRDLASAMARLAALLRQDPKALPAVEKLVEQGGCPPERLISPLLASGTPEAHASLARWVEQRESAARARLVTSELLLHEAPQRVLSEALVKAGGDPTHPAQPRAAHLAGTIAERTLESDPSYAASIVDRLLEAESNAPPEARVQLLGGLGNTASPRIVTRLEERMKESEVAVARAATAALWRVPLQRAAELLDAALAGATAPETRVAAARACQRRPPTTGCRSLVDAVRRDTDPRVRSAALDAIAASQPSSLKAALKIAAQDRDSGVRERAARLADATTLDPSSPSPRPLAGLGNTPAGRALAP